MSQKKLRVLFIDDDAIFLEMAQNVMQSFAGDAWEIHTATNAGDGLAIIQEKHIELVVVDVHMPVVNGMQFLQLLNRKHPNIARVVLSGDATEAERATCLSLGAELVLDKGEIKKSWQNIFRTLNELARLQPEEGFRGVLRRVSLPDVLQMECLSRSSAVLEISTKALRGHIFIQEGQIIHAEAGDRTGEDAFNYLMSLAVGDFNVKPFHEPSDRSISSSWEFLLMEAARKRDEASGTGDSDTKVVAKQAPAPTSGTTKVVPLAVPDALFVPTLPSEPAVSSELRPEVAEMIVCSVQGDIVYEWQCADANGRVNFLEFVSQKSRQLGVGLELGDFERLEMLSPRSRVIAQIQGEHAIIVRMNLVPETAAAA